MLLLCLQGESEILKIQCYLIPPKKDATHKMSKSSPERHKDTPSCLRKIFKICKLKTKPKCFIFLRKKDCDYVKCRQWWVVMLPQALQGKLCLVDVNLPLLQMNHKSFTACNIYIFERQTSLFAISCYLIKIKLLKFSLNSDTFQTPLRSSSSRQENTSSSVHYTIHWKALQKIFNFLQGAGLEHHSHHLP